MRLRESRVSFIVSKLLDDITEPMHWIYLSPHLDDAALSCGGLIWDQVQAGQTVDIWTFCAGDPPAAPLSPFAETLHARWQSGFQAAALRRQEDIESCKRLGATAHHFSLPDCIYRQGGEPPRFLYDSEEAIFGSIAAEETGLIVTLHTEMATDLPHEAQVVIPLALGGHIDHRLTRAVAEGLSRPGIQFWYYADYPYVLHAGAELVGLVDCGWQATTFPVTQDGLSAWQDSTAAYASQISTFWPNLAAMRKAIQEYRTQTGGLQLWQKAG